jgi:hypothetical protein
MLLRSCVCSALPVFECTDACNAATALVKHEHDRPRFYNMVHKTGSPVNVVKGLQLLLA